ncbi:MAG TPA: Tol-Pal system protein TolB, partial [Casimicrobiaceae bacterium]
MIASPCRWLAACLLSLLPLSLAQAQLSIEIVGGAAQTIPIAIVPFEAEGTWPISITGIVGADLTRSGLFRLVDTAGVVPRPSKAQDVQAAFWRARSADAVVVGSMLPLPDGRAEVRFALVDVVKQAALVQMNFTVTPQQFRITAHKIADIIYEKLTGDRGVFSTRIAYITKQGPRYQLLVADADGFGPQTIVSSNEPLLSPRWSPDGSRLAYVSFESRKPVVYVQSLDTGQRHAVANFRGSNSSPAWSPDGRKLAVTLTKDGGSQVYLMNPDGSGVTRVLTSQA